MTFLRTKKIIEENMDDHHIQIVLKDMISSRGMYSSSSTEYTTGYTRTTSVNKVIEKTVTIQEVDDDFLILSYEEKITDKGYTIPKVVSSTYETVYIPWDQIGYFKVIS